MDKMWQEIEQNISDSTQTSFHIKNRESVSGGCINTALVVEGEACDYFVKLNEKNLSSMFEAEFLGLSEIQKTNTILVPQPICCGVALHSAYIVLEKLNFGVSNTAGMSALGANLALMHKVHQSSYGLNHDNTIGATTQINSLGKNWVEFWQRFRLGFQLELAGQNGYRGSLQKKGDKLMDKMSGLFPDGDPDASLLHGDLWSGNAAVLKSGSPVIFDPAVYYGDRETDIAMTELFSGFSEHFYRSYSEHYPLDANYSIRKTFYNTYHILNHLNLFGGGYAKQAESMMDKVLSELG